MRFTLPLRRCNLLSCIAVLFFEFGTPLFQEHHVGLAATSFRLTRRRFKQFSAFTPKADLLHTSALLAQQCGLDRWPVENFAPVNFYTRQLASLNPGEGGAPRNWHTRKQFFFVNKPVFAGRCGLN